MAKAKSTKTTKPAAKKAAPKAKAKKPAAAKKPAKVVKSPEQVEAETLANAEAKLVEKHGTKIVIGSARRATDPRYGKKIMVTINTRGLDGEFDGGTREVATSDVHQVHHNDEVAAQLRKQRAAEKRAAKRAEREAATPAVDEAALDAMGL